MLAAVSTPAREILRDVFGYDEFRGQQAAAIEAALAGRDALVLMPTGGGKSVCYQVPALLDEGTAIVVSPLIALMEDQVNALRELGVAAAFLNSSLPREEQQALIAALRRGEVKLLYVAPERLVQAQTREWLGDLSVSLIAIDEAHCVSQWGHSFRKDYLDLHVLREWFSGVPRMALTATATSLVRSEIIERLALDDPAVLIGGFDRPNIRYQVQPKTDARSQLVRFLENHRDEAGIVYCLSRRKTERIAEWLNERGFDAVPYHAGLSAEDRAQHQRRFLTEDSVIVVATIAFGMGIDKPDVRFVAHLDLPKSLEAYYQETGRAGRDGLPADAWMIYGLQDVVRLRQLADESEAHEDFKRHERARLDALLGWCEVTDCRRRPLLAYFGEELTGDCGNCDNCLNPPRTRDGTVEAQMLLSAVYRTGQRFGAAHLVDVLTGKKTPKTTQHGHEALGVFGVGADTPVPVWRSIVRQLAVRGYVKADPDRYGGLVLTPASRAVLKGRETVELREDPLVPKAARKRSSKQKSPAAEIEITDLELFDALRDCRLRLAKARDVPPYVIFHDSTLRQMAAEKPADEASLLAISGVGQAKLDRYGEDFLAVIRKEG